ncbi:MAG: hypothetical protein M3280_13700 [Actinomycetota bacterium]|nr:hypothetical protein [Actinomycetota bacterium]
MRAGRITTLVAVAIVTGVMAGGPNAVAAKKPKVVGTDPAGDWAHNVNTALSPIGDQFGQDLLEAAIGLKDKKTLNFIIKVGHLPPTGGVPELTRYIWSIDVDGEYVELDGKFTNYSRGACDPTSGQCPPPRDPGMAPFMVRADCETNPDTNTSLCQEKGFVQATFDAATGTITVPVPLATINAKKKSKIGPGTSDFTGNANINGTIAAIPSAFFSSTGMPNDALTVTKTFKVPRKL